MATAFGTALRAAPEFPTLEGLAAHRGTAVHWCRAGRKTIHRVRLCFIRPATQPCAALQWGGCRGWCTTALRMSYALARRATAAWVHHRTAAKLRVGGLRRE
jgi:hypothetical protein